MNLRTILFSQYPALFLLAVLFLIAHLRVRKTSAVKSVLWVILFGAALAASVVCCFLGIQAELWTLKTLITLGFWSWFGVGLVLLFLVLRVVHGMEKRSSRRRLDKAMKQAEKQKEEEVSRARAEGAAAERERASAILGHAAAAANMQLAITCVQTGLSADQAGAILAAAPKAPAPVAAGGNFAAAMAAVGNPAVSGIEAAATPADDAAALAAQVVASLHAAR